MQIGKSRRAKGQPERGREMGEMKQGWCGQDPSEALMMGELSSSVGGGVWRWVEAGGGE